MTLVLNDRRTRYVASADQTSFDVDFPIDTDADIAVYHKVDATGVITLLTLTTDYTVTLDGAAPNTADVDLVVGAAVNDIITVEGETDPDRDTDFTTGGDFFAGTVNDAEDRQYRIDQETKRDRDRTVVSNRVSPDTFDPTLPDVVGAALKTVRINAAETAFEFTEPTGQGEQGEQGETGAAGADGDMVNPMTARGDIITGAAAGPGDPQRLAIGADGTYAKSDGVDPSWGSLDLVDDTTPQQGGAVDSNGFSYNGSEGAEIVSGYTFDFATTDVDVGNNLITETGHKLAANVVGQFTTTTTLPAGLSLATDYHVISSGITDDVFKVSASEGGAEIDITDQGTGTHTFTRNGGAMNIWDGDGSTKHVSGVVKIEDFTDAPRIGSWVKLVFDGVLIITDGSGIGIVGSANYTTAAGDIVLVYADAVDAFLAFILKADGTAVVGGGGGAWNLIGTAEAPGGTGVAALTVTGLDSTYDTYAISLSDIVPITDGAEAFLRVGDSGGVDSGASDYDTENSRLAAAGETYISNTSAAEIILVQPGNGVGSAAGEGIGGMLILPRPGDGTTRPIITGNILYYEAGTAIIGMNIFGSRAAVITLDRIQFLFGSGNVETGRLTVWGIAHA